MRKSIIDALLPKTRQTVLTAFFLQPDKWWYLSDLASHLKLTPSSLQRELASLKESQLLEIRKEANRIYYKANMSCPGAQDLQALLIKTSGITDVLKATFKNFTDDVLHAFIYGSLAKGEEISTSDVDVMLIGNISLLQIAATVKKAEKLLSREVNITTYTQRDFTSKLKRNDSFLKTVLAEPKIFLKGDENGLKALVK